MAPTTPTAYRAWARRTRLARDVTRVKITARGARRPCSRAPVVGLSRPWAARAPFRSPSRNGHLGPKSKTLAVRPRSSQTTKRPLARRSARPAGLSGSARARATLPRETGGPADTHVSNLSVRVQIVITDRGGRCGAAGRGSGASWSPFRIDRSVWVHAPLALSMSISTSREPLARSTSPYTRPKYGSSRWLPMWSICINGIIPSASLTIASPRRRWCTDAAAACASAESASSRASRASNPHRSSPSFALRIGMRSLWSAGSPRQIFTQSTSALLDASVSP
ncbi:hypothetical protein M885DRAFT_78328 [Pelagophyceae sp. CCMP2097]|nr:hypothetical protein M885DRAFT_78328 [Pelagophyceae sp. CCMP2097]